MQAGSAIGVAQPNALITIVSTVDSQNEGRGKCSEWVTNSDLPLEIDVGCHRGAFVLDMAMRYPQIRFLGIERQRNRVERCDSKIRRHGLQNAFVVQGDGLEAATHVLAPRSVEKIHVSFPDPWPKRRHHVRRMVRREFLTQAHQLLRCGGEIRLMTDDEPYFRAMEAVVRSMSGYWVEVPWDDGRAVAQTEFQRKFAAKGLVPFRLACRACG